MNVGNEGAVDLDLVGGDVGERRQRRVADSEIVDRDADAELTENRQDFRLEVGLGDESVFRHLDHKSPGKTGPLQRPCERAHEFRISSIANRSDCSTLIRACASRSMLALKKATAPLPLLLTRYIAISAFWHSTP